MRVDGSQTLNLRDRRWALEALERIASRLREEGRIRRMWDVEGVLRLARQDLAFMDSTVLREEDRAPASS